MKTCLIRQPAGIGDILFCLKIAQDLKQRGYEILWPVIQEFSWIKQYISGINFPIITDSFFKKEIYLSRNPIIIEDFIFFPFQDADQHYPFLPIIDSKYTMAELSYDHWQDFITINRNSTKEKELYTRMNPENESFILVNKNYGSPPNFKSINYIPEFNGIKTINIGFYDNFSLFDWMLLIEKAKEIHIVDSSLSCIIESMPSVTCPLYSYSRYNPHSFHQTKHLYHKNWNFII